MGTTKPSTAAGDIIFAVKSFIISFALPVILILTLQKD